jgi:hypothetical protein
LDDPLYNTAQGIRMIGEILEMNGGNRHHSGSKGNKRQGPHAYRFAGEIPIKSNEDADNDSRG